MAEAERLRLDQRLAYALRLLCSLRVETNEMRGAIEVAKRGVALEARFVHGLGDEQGAVARGARHDFHDVGLMAAAAIGDVDEGARFLEVGRAVALREALEARRTTGAAIPADLVAAETAAREAEARAIAAYRAALAGGSLAEIRTRRAEADAATAAVEAVIERIQRTAKRGSSLVLPKADDLETLQARLAPDEAFLTYTYTGAHAVAFVVTHSSAQFVGLGKVEAIHRNCERLHAYDPEVPEGEIAKALHPIGGHLVRRFRLPEGVRRIYVSPEGRMAEVPFALLFPGHEVVYEPSCTTYGLLRDEKHPHGTGILALGDPDYGAPDAAPGATRESRDGRGTRLAALPATREEARAVGDVVLLGREATEADLRVAIASHAGRFRAIHFACHGLVDPDHPARCSLTPAPPDDGYLTVRELLGIEVPADLAVLSACETGKGRIVRAEGVLGLSRAFMYAGVPRVICSLWRVDDQATRALMSAFYERWKSGVPAATALREAQSHVRAQERWRHPSYWAAWVLWGLPE